MTNEKVMDLRPRPARRAGRILAGMSMILTALPGLLQTFELISWTGDQIGAFTSFVGVVVAATALFLGRQVEGQVTPVSDPRDNALVPMVPIANDGLDD